MSGVATASDFVERPVWIEAGSETLYGVLTVPTGEPADLCALLLSGAGRKGGGVPSPGRNRVWVHLARELASTGVASLRLDFRGIGESTGSVTDYDLRKPFAEDVQGAAAWAIENGFSRVALIGTCFGGRAALAVSRDIEGLAGVGLLAAPVLDFDKDGSVSRAAVLPASFYAKKAFDPRALRQLLDSETRAPIVKVVRQKLRLTVDRKTREDRGGDGASPRVVRQLDHLVDQGVPVLFVYGVEDPYRQDLDRALAGPAARTKERAGSLWSFDVVSGRVHGMTSIETQRETVAAVRRWFATNSDLRASAQNQKGDAS